MNAAGHQSYSLLTALSETSHNWQQYHVLARNPSTEQRSSNETGTAGRGDQRVLVWRERCQGEKANSGSTGAES